MSIVSTDHRYYNMLLFHCADDFAGGPGVFEVILNVHQLKYGLWHPIYQIAQLRRPVIYKLYFKTYTKWWYLIQERILSYPDCNIESHSSCSLLTTTCLTSSRAGIWTISVKSVISVELYFRLAGWKLILAHLDWLGRSIQEHINHEQPEPHKY